MNRRQFGQLTAGAVAGLAFTPWAELLAQAPRGVVALGSGPYPLIDDYLLSAAAGLERHIEPPSREPAPVLSSAGFGTTQPYFSVISDQQRGVLRGWYNRGSAIGHAVSADGVSWHNPTIAWNLPRAFGCSVVDDGHRNVDQRYRFKLANWRATRAVEDTPADDSGLWVGGSADGLLWTEYPGPVLRRYPDGFPTLVPHGVHDIVEAYWDAAAGHYGCAVKLLATAAEMPPGPRGSGTRRLCGLTTSTDFVNWTRPQRLFVPDAQDEGLLEFYAMAGMHLRGSLRIGLLRILRDDLGPEPGGAADGIGYTVLATSRDGVTWQRDRLPFLDRNPRPGTWDRAMAWGSATLDLGHERLIYYGGYARGHRQGVETERQIGLARMPRDRYVARVAGSAGGSFQTPLFMTNASAVTVNARIDGELRVAIFDEWGRVQPGFDFVDCLPIRGDALDHPVVFAGTGAGLRLPARLEVRARNARIYALNFVA